MSEVTQEGETGHAHGSTPSSATGRDRASLSLRARAARPARSQVLARLRAEFAPTGEVDGAVDRLVRHPHRGLAGVGALQPDGDPTQRFCRRRQWHRLALALLTRAD